VVNLVISHRPGCGQLTAVQLLVVIGSTRQLWSSS
jgi:hypothetical protein